MIRLTRAAMPQLGEEVKDLVADGVWSLYALKGSDLCLLFEDHRKGAWLLNSEGQVVDAQPVTSGYELFDLIVFDHRPNACRASIRI